MSIKPTTWIHREQGQSVIMVSIIVVVLIALVALVVDVGNAYAQRRIVQNAADAAALAATRELARGANTTNRQVLQKAKEFAALNGIDANTVTAKYFSFNPDNQQMTELGVVTDVAVPPPANANGVRVELARTFNTYLAQVVGWRSLNVKANSNGLVSKGVCVAGGGSGLFPAAVDIGLFDNIRDNGKPTYDTVTYRIWGDKAAPGNFHWVSWNGDPSNTTLVANLHDTSRSGEWTVKSYIPGGPGVMDSSDVNSEMNVRVSNTDPSRPAKVLVPLYDQVVQQGNNAQYRIIGFAWFVITDYNFQGKDKYIEGYFTRGVVTNSEGGCYDAGTSTVKLRPPMELHRTIEGRIAYQYLKPNQPTGQTAYPVDVVLVIDTSGSMADTWGGNNEPKIQTARNALRDFTAKLRPDVGDQVALVHFPQLTGGTTGDMETFPKRYTCSCPYIDYRYNPPRQTKQTSSYKLQAEVLSDLSNDFATVRNLISSLGANGGTPIADALSKALEILNGPKHVASHAKVVILASDGMTNATLDMRWTGYSGNDMASMGDCNGQAVTQAIQVANQLREAGVTLFTLAIGNDFNSSLLQTMASPDTDPSKPHFFLASNPTAMQQIYDSLGERIINYGGECTITPIETAGAGAHVEIWKNGAKYAETTASASGSFTFRDVEPGTYTFVASLTRDGLTYNVFTAGIGGPQIANPTLVVGQAEGVYFIDLALKTNASPSCGGM